MAAFQEHLKQAKRNLSFLNSIHTNVPDCTDWQVTTCFYCALHLLNAYLANEQNLHYSTHKEMENALNWANTLSLTKLSQDDFTTYQKLRNLSRRSRYLCSESGVSNIAAQLTNEKEFAKSIICLDKLMVFFLKKYKAESLQKTKLKCPTLAGESLKFFEIEQIKAAV